MWSERLEKITSVSEQLFSHVALNIMMNLEDAHSTYAQSFHLVKREIAKVGYFKHCQTCVRCKAVLLDTPFYTISNNQTLSLEYGAAASCSIAFLFCLICFSLTKLSVIVPVPVYQNRASFECF